MPNKPISPVMIGHSATLNVLCTGNLHFDDRAKLRSGNFAAGAMTHLAPEPSHVDIPISVRTRTDASDVRAIAFHYGRHQLIRRQH
jgi:hypothetical protein